MRSIKEIFRSYAEFDAQGRHTNGCDKQSNHNYSDAYESIISNNFSTGPAIARNAVNLMMEIGVADGSSLLAWSEIFPNAAIVGLDIHPISKNGPRIEFHIGDQKVKTDCERAANNRLFDIIVEDAWHSTENTLLTLFWLWPFVRVGGLYIVEEWQNICGDAKNVKGLFPNVEIVDTNGPFGNTESLVVMRKLL